MHRRLAIPLLALGVLFACGHARASQWCENVVVGMQYQNSGGNSMQVPIYEQQCSWVAGAIAFDSRTRAFASAWSNPSADDALATAVRMCGAKCVGFSFFDDYGWVAFAEDDSAYGYSSVSAQDAAMRCQSSTSSPCETVIGGSSTAAAVYWYYGALAYDAASGRSGKSANRLRRSDAMAEASRECGAPGCWAYGFQSGYGAIAKSTDGRLFGAWSDRQALLASAARDAKKACKKQTDDRKCEVVLEGTAFDAASATRDAEAQLKQALESSGR